MVTQYSGYRTDILYPDLTHLFIDILPVPVPASQIIYTLSRYQPPTGECVKRIKVEIKVGHIFARLATDARPALELWLEILMF